MIPVAEPGGRHREWQGAAAVALVALVVYLPSLRNGFAYDDIRVIVNRPDLLDLSHWRQILVAGWWPHALYRPLSRLSLALDWSVGGGAPWVFHLVNVVLHASVTVLVWFFGRRTLSSVGATAAALLFAVHPVHVEAVANVVGRAEILAGLFAMLAAWSYRLDGELARAGQHGPRRLATSFGTLAATGVGLASKETAFAIPGLLLLVDSLDARAVGEPFDVRIRRHWVLWGAATVLAVEWLLLRTVVLGDLAGDEPAPGLFGEGLLGRVLVMSPIVLEYLRLLVFPARLSADYSPDFVPAVAAVTVRGVLGMLVVLGGVGLAVRMRRQHPTVTVGLAWTGATLLIVSNLLVPTGVLLAERSMYLPSVGIVLIGGVLADAAWRWRRRWAVVVVGALTVLAGIRVVTRIPVWRDNDTLLPQLVRDAPGSFRSMWVAAALNYVHGDRETGEWLIRSAIRVYPLHANLWQDLGRQLQREERWSEAADAFAAAYRLGRNRWYDAASAASNLVRAGRLDSAEVVVRDARREAPDDPGLMIAASNLALARHRPLEAMTWRRQAAWQMPANARYWALAAEAALAAGYCPEVRRALFRVNELDSTFVGLDAMRDSARTAGCPVT